MTRNSKKNLALIISSILLFTALINGLPYGFFTFLRFVIFVIASYIAWMAYDEQKEGWVWIFLIIAILFNPFIPIYLKRDIWKIIDLMTGIFLMAAIFILKFKKDSA